MTKIKIITIKSGIGTESSIKIEITVKNAAVHSRNCNGSTISSEFMSWENLLKMRPDKFKLKKFIGSFNKCDRSLLWSSWEAFKQLSANKTTLISKNTICGIPSAA